MKNKIGTIKTCGNCKHFKIVKKGLEFKNILDTAYLISRCRIKGWETKEYYLRGVKQPLVLNDPGEECPFWEEWKPRRRAVKVRSEKVGSGK